MKLSKLKVGQSAIIKEVGGEGIVRHRFLEMGIIPGTRIYIQAKAPLGDPIEISLRGYELTLRADDVENIEVSVEL